MVHGLWSPKFRTLTMVLDSRPSKTYELISRQYFSGISAFKEVDFESGGESGRFKVGKVDGAESGRSVESGRFS